MSALYPPKPCAGEIRKDPMTEETFPCAGGCGATCRPFRGRKTRLCAACNRSANGRNPNKNRLNREAMKRHMSDPAYRERALRRAHEGYRKRMAADPDMRARISAQAKAMAATRAGIAAQPSGSEPRRRAVESRRRTLLGWCPEAYLPEYQRLVYSKRLRAAEARAIIEAQIKADEARLTPHERQLQKIAHGAQLTRKFVAPSPASAFTLGGVGSGMI